VTSLAVELTLNILTSEALVILNDDVEFEAGLKLAELLTSKAPFKVKAPVLV